MLDRTGLPCNLSSRVRLPGRRAGAAIVTAGTVVSAHPEEDRGPDTNVDLASLVDR
jgi:hypothetical protein